MVQTGPSVTPSGTSAQLPQAPTEPTSGRQRMIPFRIATNERTEILQTESGTIAANEQVFDRTLEGTGYVYAIHLNMQVVTAGNAAAVTFAEDGPFNALSQVIYRDPTGEAVNLPGWSAYLANVIMRNYATFYPDPTFNIIDTSTEFFSAITGAVATGGSFNINTRIPIAINRRNLLGLLGNQDRGVKYQLRSNVASTAAIYGTAPTAPGAFTIQKHYESYAVPSPVGAYGAQQYIPDGFGTIHFLTQNVSEAVPAASVTLNHYMRRIGNMWRWVALVIRGNTRALGQANTARIQMKVGDTDFYNEQYYYRRLLMAERFGFKLPPGVLVYDFIHDFLPFAGAEMGDDWVNTKDVNTAQFLITYLAGIVAGGSLTFISDDLALVGQPIGS